jgi:hypothetical protein
MRLRRKKPMERLLDSVGDVLDVVTDAAPGVPELGSPGTRRTGLVVAGTAVGLTAASAGISSLRRRVAGSRDAS